MGKVGVADAPASPIGIIDIDESDWFDENEEIQ
jgi:hypothetical protein